MWPSSIPTKTSVIRAVIDSSIEVRPRGERLDDDVVAIVWLGPVARDNDCFQEW